MKRELV